MYYINKIVGWALSPMGILFLGIGLGLVLRCKCRKIGAWVIGATLVAFWFLGTGIATRVIGVPLEGEEREVGSGQWVVGREVDAIVLLGGGMGAHEKCGRAEMFQGADRVWKAAKLWKQLETQIASRYAKLDETCVPTPRASADGTTAFRLPITLSGGGVKESTTPLLKDLGIPEDVLMYFPEARNTEEEAKLIAAAGIKRILLVTSAWHMPRARMLFERAGLEVVAAPCDYEMHYAAEEPIEIKDFFPSAEALHRNSDAMKEWVARAGYGLLRR